MMLYAVAGIGILCFFGGLAVAEGRYVLAGLVIAGSIALALRVRWRFFEALDEALQRGVDYRDATRRRVRELPLATTPMKRKNKPDAPPLDVPSSLV